MKVLVVGAPAELAASVKAGITLAWADSETLTASSGAEGLNVLDRESPGLVVVDLVSMNGNGFDFLASVRRISDVPVLIISSETDETTRSRGLDLGADDYIAKPFSRDELLARLRVMGRRARSHARPPEDEVISSGNITIDLASGRVYVNGVEAVFSATEWKLLAYLARNSGKVIPAQALAVNVWGLNYVESSTIKMCIRRLRQKLGDNTQAPRLIRSYRGRGYSFELKS